MTTNLKPFSENVSFAGQPTSAELKLWSETGIRSVVNMRPDSEVERGLSPAEEEQACRELGMSYFHLPTGLDGLDQTFVSSARDTLEKAERPMVIHCAGGARAAILAATLHSMAEGVSPEEAIAMAEASGQSFNSDLRQKIVSLIESSSQQ